MDVRCEKCQTEYELDESRLKPGGVTVKCTNCGHMFKIRKRANTNVGVPTVPEPRTRPTSSKPPTAGPAGVPSKVTDIPSGPSADRQWLVRLENGETKTCRELATLQQWIVAGVVSRESLISRTGKTWKRLGDVTELAQYFVIADEARAQRAVKPTNQPSALPAATMMGFGAAHESDDDLERRSTGNFRVRSPTPQSPTPAARPLPLPADTPTDPNVSPMAQTELSIPMPAAKDPGPQRPKPPSGGRATAAWASDQVKASESMAAMPQGPRSGKVSAGHDEPAFAGRVRMSPGADTFEGRVGTDIDDEDFYPAARGSRAGTWIALVSLLVIGAAAGAVYMLVFRNRGGEQVAQPTKRDAAAVAAPADAPAVVITPVDATEALSPIDTARAELLAGVATRMQKAFDALNGKDDPPTLSLRARLQTAIAQAMLDRAGFVDKPEGDKLRKDAKQIVIDAAPMAQRAYNGQADNASANLAMADVMRLQAKPAPAVRRYIDAARSKAGSDKELLASIALAEAQLLMRDGKLPDAQKAIAGIEAPDDMRVKLASALILYQQNKQADAKANVDQVLATQPDNDLAAAMYKKLETSVAKTDPLPPEDGSAKPPSNGGSAKPPGGGAAKPSGGGNTGGGGGGGGGGGHGDYDSLLKEANKLAERNCGKAMELFSKALEQKPNGVEALTGMGYCQLDAKQFSSAFSKFRAALAVSPRYEPALGGVAETYQRQGNKESAIDAWKKYLEIYPGSAKAKKQLEILGEGKETPKEPPKESPPPAGGGSGG